MANAPDIRIASDLMSAGRYAEAVQILEGASQSAPGDPAVWHTLGEAYLGTGAAAAAARSYAEAARLDPANAALHYNLGNILRTLGQLELAITSYQRALSLDPNFAEAHGNLGNVLLDAGEREAAITSYLKSLEIRPRHARTLNNLGSAHLSLQEPSDALRYFKASLDVEPSFAPARLNLAEALKQLGFCREAVAVLHAVLTAHPNWGAVVSNLLSTQCYLSDTAAQNQCAQARQFTSRAFGGPWPSQVFSNRRDPARQLRVGFVSGDFRQHPAAYFLESTVKALCTPTHGLQLLAYSTHPHVDETTRRLQSTFSDWTPAYGLSDAQLVEHIRRAEVDVLVDLSGHTANNRLGVFARRAAPIQVSWLGYFSTTGLTEIDYFLADPYCAPASIESHFVEKIWRLPDIRMCFTPPDAAIVPSPLPALSNGRITFANFSNFAKINERTLALWSRVMRELPTSRLFIKSPQLKDASVRKLLIERLATMGVGQDRLLLEPASNRLDYLHAYHHVDIVLDTFPFPGGTTTAEALWMGVPTLTLCGETLLSLQGRSLMTNAGLNDWVAHNEDEFVQLARWHAGDADKLASVRRSLRSRVMDSPVFDANRFATNFAAALREMWQLFCRS
jgi:protein O-GlcNAc transferase